MMHYLKKFLFFSILALSLQAHSAPKAELWDRWLEHDIKDQRVVDHTSWNQFLQQYVITDANQFNRVAYRNVTQEDKTTLKQYIKLTSALPISHFNQDQQLAFWINLYNALTIDIVLDHYPVESIFKINLSSGFFTRGPWKKKIITVENETLSLDDIEHRILRPIWKDPRIHYAVNCASVGCPNLNSRAFTANNIEDQLNDAAIAFINHSRGVSIEEGKLTVSSIYEWFKEDFGNNDKDIIHHLIKYAKPALKKQLGSLSKINDDQYNWQLNDYE